MDWLKDVSAWLTVVGGVNWALEAWNYNLVTKFVPTAYVNYVYYVIGAAAVVTGYYLVKKK